MSIQYPHFVIASLLTLKPFLGSLKTPEDKNPSYFLMVLKLVRSLGSLKTPKTVNVSIFGNGSKVCSNVCNMGCQISYGFMLWKSMTTLGSKRTPEMRVSLVF